jgi:hypothetical protein
MLKILFLKPESKVIQNVVQQLLNTSKKDFEEAKPKRCKDFNRE